MSISYNDAISLVGDKAIPYVKLEYNENYLFSMFFYDNKALNMSSVGTSLKPKKLDTRMMLSNDGTTITWRDDDIRIKKTVLAQGETAAATTITVTTGEGAFFVAKDVIRNATKKENMVIASIAGDVITLTAGISQDFDAADSIVWVSYPDRNRPISRVISDKQTNLTTYTSELLEVTQVDLNKQFEDTESAVVHYESYVMEGVRRILKQINNDFYVGNGTTQGLEDIVLADNIFDFAALTDKERWLAVLRAIRVVSKIGTKRNNEMLMVLSSEAYNNLIGLIGSFTDGFTNVNITTTEVKSIGLTIDQLSTGYGKVNIFVDETLDDLYDDDNVGFLLKPSLVGLIMIGDYPLEDASGAIKIKKVNGIGVFNPPQTDPRFLNIEYFTNYSFMWGGNTAGAYVKMTNIGS